MTTAPAASTDAPTAPAPDDTVPLQPLPLGGDEDLHPGCHGARRRASARALRS